MWINPKYADTTPPPAEPPREEGRVLASLPRGREGEVRICLDEYKGNPFVSLRLWSPDRDRCLWPAKGKGISIRMREIDAVRRALAEAIELTEGSPDGPAGP